MNHIVLLIFSLIILNSHGLFHNSIKKLKEKAKSMYQKNFGKDKSWRFTGHDITEYPGSNAELRKIHEQKWNEYYACLKLQDENLGILFTATPEAIIGFEGTSINVRASVSRLSCKICLSPVEKEQSDDVVWEWASKKMKRLETLEYSDNILISPEDKSLHIYNLQIEHTGQYKCQLGESLTVPYFLTVLSLNDDLFVEVHALTATMGPYAQDPQKIDGYNLILDTEWGDWSTCNKCGEVGKRHKLGFCTISKYKLDTDAVSSNLNVTQNVTSNKPLQIRDEDEELLKIFKYGIPCNSHIITDSLKKIPELNERKNEIMVGYCKVQCKDEKIFEVEDQDGNVIEKANNSAGIYSMLQGIPPMEPPVERRLQYGVKGKEIILTCPGNINSDAPIVWQIGSKNVISDILTKETNGRIYVSITDKIHIKKAQIADSNIYSCWQLKELAGTIRLVIEKKIQLDFNHHLMLLGVVIILTTFLYVFIRAFFGRKYAKIIK